MILKETVCAALVRALHALGLEAPSVLYIGGSDVLPPPLPRDQEEAAIPALELAEKAAETLFRAQDAPLCWLESAAHTAGVDPTHIYTVEQLSAAFLKAYPLEQYRRFAALFGPNGPDAPTAARAGVQPAEYLAAVAFHALAEGKA